MDTFEELQAARLDATRRGLELQCAQLEGAFRLKESELGREKTAHGGTVRQLSEVSAASAHGYSERNLLAALLVRLALTRLGWRAWLGVHAGADYEPGYRNIVYLETPHGQVSWHIHDSDLPLFGGIETGGAPDWDDHNRDEKIARLTEILNGLAPRD